jgi:outer membrane protein TolC
MVRDSQLTVAERFLFIPKQFMNRRRASFIVVVFVLAAGVALADEAAPMANGATVTLRQCYTWALTRSEDLKIRREDVRQSGERARAAIGDALPNVSWEFSDTWQDPNGVDELDQQGFGGFVQKDQVESRFRLRQPLFSGFKEFSAYSGFKREKRRNELLLDRASIDLYERTSDAFYNVVDRETYRTNTQTSLELAEDQVKALKGFLKLGKSRESEVFTAEAHAAALRAQLDQIAADIYTAREELSYLTGHDLSMGTVVDEIPETPTYGTLQETLVRARNRTDLRAQREDVASKQLQIRYEKGFYWPSSDVVGNYYTKRAAYLNAINWDVILSLHVPLYQGGTVAANVREAQSAYEQSELTLEQMEREIVYDVRKTYGELSASLREVRSLNEAARAAQQSYDSQRKEYRLGLVTNLDVLQALDFLQAQRSARDTARLKAKKLFIQLNVELENMP